MGESLCAGYEGERCQLGHQAQYHEGLGKMSDLRRHIPPGLPSTSITQGKCIHTRDVNLAVQMLSA